MKRTLILTLLLFGIFSTSAQLDRSKLPEPSTPRPVNIGSYESFELKNDLRVFVIENHKLPRVSFNLILDRMPLLEKEKIGYLNMVGDLMRRGTTTRSKEVLDEEIDFLGATLSVSSKGIYASGLSKHQDKILDLMLDILLNPTFPAEELEKIKKQTISGLAAAKENPNAIASNLDASVVYGSNHPYGEIETEETVGNITLEDIIKYHQQYFIPNIAYLAIVGDVSVKDIKKKIKKAFGKWEQGTVIPVSYDRPTAPDITNVNLVNRSSAVQSVINVTYPVHLPIGSPEAVKVEVMNQILGGSFSGKLNMNLREDKGFTYGSRSSLSEDKLIANFSASADVRNDVTDSAITEILYEMEQMRLGAITAEELALAKNSISGNFSRSLESSQTVSGFALKQSIYNLSKDYYATYLQKVQAVTLDDVQAMAKKYLNPKKVNINVVGKANDIEEKLEKFGEIKYFDTEGNEVDPNTIKIPEGLTASDVIKKYRDALGEETAIANIKNTQSVFSASMQGQTLGMTSHKTIEGKSSMTLSMAGNTLFSLATDGEDVSTPPNGPPMSDAEKEEFIFSEALFSEFSLKDKGAKISLSGVEKIDGKDHFVVFVELPQGASYSLFFDTETGLKTRLLKKIKSPQGDFDATVDYGDYQKIEGVLFPHSVIQQTGPQRIESAAKEILVNQPIEESIFEVK